MAVEKNQFFYDVTSRICGSLKIETGLFQTFEYIREHIPVETMYLGLHDIYKKTYHVLAHADASGGHTDRLFFETSNITLPHLSHYFSDRKTLIVDECDQEPVIKAFYPKSAYFGKSAIILPLTLEESLLGVLVLFGKEVFSHEHAELIGSVTMPFALALANARKYIELTRLKEDLIKENAALRTTLSGNGSRHLIGIDKGLKHVYEMMEMVAPLRNPVLLLGETRTGKEVIADTIHQLSLRKGGPLVKVNCGAIPPGLIDSELFGHEKGAFTGANTMKPGRFERANHGTIFLDEIGELPLDAQVRLLRVLQEGEIERVGGSETIKIDIRIIAATHRNLAEMVRKGEFREDLYFRLNVFPIMIPPLRERREDIPDLIRYFIKSKCKELNMHVTPEVTEDALAGLMAYNWPGNIRELQNVVERGLILERNQEVLAFRNLLPESSYKDDDTIVTLDEMEKEYIKKVLKLCGGRISGPNGAAVKLGMNPSTLRNRMYKHGLL